MLEERDIKAIAGLITKSEAMLLEELDRSDRKNEKRYETLAKEIGDLRSIWQMTKNENDTINTLLRIIENMEKRLSDLEKKIA